MIYVGNHISSSKGFEAMGKQALKLGANSFAFFTRNPRGGAAKEIIPKDVEAFLALAKEHKWGKLVAHAPYTMNPCSDKPSVREFAWRVFGEDLERMEYIPGNYYNFHPGSHVGQGTEMGIDWIIRMLNTHLKPEQHTTVLLETMAGKGSEIGGSFQELRAIWDGVMEKEKLGICLDTCHVWDAGYDIRDHLEAVVEEFDQVIGLDHLKALHVNDSQNPMGARKDRHARIGEGHIGKEAFGRIVRHPVLGKLPMILETPNDDEGWTGEIALFRQMAEAPLA
ncbi:MAG: deoxyribonuclease IV [Lachnospiraceae bacterium]|jgi:deoxyribonuclease-4|nr:deoxyribonuclease IV [Lachnospiraceae bacterium]MCI9133175.1 deoxyribonuclease IV [Lachnospiraceae bacterium]